MDDPAADWEFFIGQPARVSTPASVRKPCGSATRAANEARLWSSVAAPGGALIRRSFGAAATKPYEACIANFRTSLGLAGAAVRYSFRRRLAALIRFILGGPRAVHPGRASLHLGGGERGAGRGPSAPIVVTGPAVTFITGLGVALPPLCSGASPCAGAARA